MKHFLLGLMVCCTATLRAQTDDLSCLTKDEQRSASLDAHLKTQAYAALDRRLQAYEQLKTPEQIRARQTELRAFFRKQLGAFPDQTPLHAKTVRTLQADGYRIECVVFESRPNHHVTANFYLPDNATAPVPGVVVSSGHSRTGKTADYNQRYGIALAQSGMAALCFDPIGQGERSQILDETGQPKFGGTTTEHFLMGIGSTLVGRSTAHYRVWDAMRAIDYLVSRPEIDASRIGMTGCSGGGTLTSYVMALDDRVACAAPACYLTTFRRLLETIGPQDAEQNVYGQIAFGMDHPDYVIMRAPRPTLISSTTADFFSVDGSWENFRQSKRVYGKLGFPERVDLVEIEGDHGVQPQNLATIVSWMKRWLLHDDQPVPAAAISTRPPEQLLCTETSQVLTAFANERSVFDLNAVLASDLKEKRASVFSRRSPEDLRANVRELLGVPHHSEIHSPKFEHLGRITKTEYHIDKFVLRRESSIPLPGLTFHPPAPEDDAYLYLQDAGKLGESQPNGSIEKLLEDNRAIVTVDLSGQGETATGEPDPLLTDWKTYYLSYLLGRPLLGIRVEDALAAAEFVAHYEKPEGSQRRVHLVGTGQAGIVALHAAALRPQLFATVTIKHAPTDWTSLTSKNTPTGQLDGVVHGALEVYDLPDLIALIGKEKVSIQGDQD